MYSTKNVNPVLHPACSRGVESTHIYAHTHIYIYINICIFIRGPCGLMVMAVGNGYGYMSSSPGGG